MGRPKKKQQGLSVVRDLCLIYKIYGDKDEHDNEVKVEGARLRRKGNTSWSGDLGRGRSWSRDIGEGELLYIPMEEP